MKHLIKYFNSLLVGMDDPKFVRMADGKLVRVVYQPETGYMVPILKPCKVLRQPLKHMA